MTTGWSASIASHAARTDVGIVRDHNEDRFLARPPLFVVADGLGGQAAGEVAAQLLVDRLDRLPSSPTAAELVAGIESANGAIRDAASAEDGLRGMSTTCVAFLLTDTGAQVVHVGDSRAYRLRAGALERLTEDHSVVAELVRGGVIDASAAETDQRRHMLTQALGSANRIAIASASLDVAAGDRYLLCSDGLHGQVADAEIEAVLRPESDPGVAADELVRRANAAGGNDNVTVIVIDAHASSGAAVPRERPAVSWGRARPMRILAVLIAVFVVATAIGLALAGAFSPAPVPSPSARLDSPAGTFVIGP